MASIKSLACSSYLDVGQLHPVGGIRFAQKTFRCISISGLAPTLLAADDAEVIGNKFHGRCISVSAEQAGKRRAHPVTLFCCRFAHL
jgi:hypothetical protein